MIITQWDKIGATVMAQERIEDIEKKGAGPRFGSQYSSKQMHEWGCLSEMIFNRMFPDLKPSHRLETGYDPGYDFVNHKGKKIDVKFTPLWYGSLMMTFDKTHRSPADIFVLMTFNEDKTELFYRGYYLKADLCPDQLTAQQKFTGVTYVISQKNLKDNNNEHNQI